MRIKNIQIREVRLSDIPLDIIRATTVYNLLDDDNTPVATKRVDIAISGQTKDMLKVIIKELAKSIEANDRINTKHELYEDIEHPKQQENKIRKLDKELRSKEAIKFKKKLELPPDMANANLKKQKEKKNV